MNRKYNHLYAIPYYLWLGLFVILPLVLVWVLPSLIFMGTLPWPTMLSIFLLLTISR